MNGRLRSASTWVTPDKAVEAPSKYGGTVLRSSLSNEAQRELQEALHGEGSDNR
jgi:uncharacterized membrane protein